MILRSRDAILRDMEAFKSDFDAFHFGAGQPLAAEYKRGLLPAWYILQAFIGRLMRELEALDCWEREQRVTRMLTVASRPLWFERQEKLRVGR